MTDGVPNGIRKPGQPTNQHESVAVRDREPGAAVTDSDAKCPTPGERVAACDSANVVEVALADALTRAAAASAWSAVEALTAELRARREARAGVVNLRSERARRGR